MAGVILVRRFEQGDIGRVLELLNWAFLGWGSSREWFWKFKASEAVNGRRPVVFVVEHRGGVVGHLGFIPMNVRVGGEVFQSCQLVDGVLDVRYRGKGVYTTLVSAILSRAKEENSSLIFGFANEPAFHNYSRHGDFLALCKVAKMFRTLSFRHILGSVRVRFVEKDAGQPGQSHPIEAGDSPKSPLILLGQLVKIMPVLGVAFLRQCLGSRGNGSVTEAKDDLLVVETRDFGKIAKLSVGLLNRSSLVVERSSGFLRWRYSRPEVKYKFFVVEKSGVPLGYFIIGQKERSISVGRVEFARLRIGYIMDLVSDTKWAGQLLLKAEEELKKQNSSVAQFWTNEGSTTYDMLRMFGYERLPGEVTMVVNATEPVYRETILRNLESITISLGDTDHA